MNPADQRLNALLDAAVDSVLLIDPDGIVTRFNAAAEKVFGYRADQVVGRNVRMLMPPSYYDEHDGHLRRYRATGEKRIIGLQRQAMGRRANGSVFPIELSVGEFIGGGEHGFVGIVRDISERCAQEARLEQQAEELRVIFENAPTAILIARFSGHIIKANRACCEMLGYGVSELVTMHQSDLVHGEDRSQAEERIREASQGAESSELELRYVRRDGSIIPTRTYTALAGRMDGGLIISEIVDRSALMEAEQEAGLLRERLAHASRVGTLGEMVSGIAHEVNQPLTAIANYASACRRMLHAGQFSPQELGEALEKINRQAERAGQVIRSLRALTRKRDAVREQLQINQLITEVARLLEFELRNSGWRLQLLLSPALPAMAGDGVQIQQVVLNLVRNGLEAMSERATGDTLEIATSAAEPGWIEIIVRDCGPGMTEVGLAHLFEPFHTTKSQGMGLGLSFCSSIIRAHGGSIHYRENEKGGACFVLKMPTAESD